MGVCALRPHLLAPRAAITDGEGSLEVHPWHRANFEYQASLFTAPLRVDPELIGVGSFVKTLAREEVTSTRVGLVAFVADKSYLVVHSSVPIVLSRPEFGDWSVAS